MGELYDMDLKGRPLAYTPFCDNNKEMDGYRFWKQVSYQLSKNYSTAVDQIIYVNSKINTVFSTVCWLILVFYLLVKGFWKDHLRGRPYHIRWVTCSMKYTSIDYCYYCVNDCCCCFSALYVVDLAKFRQTAAGDNLRVVYETLSKDPNSLSNLDQVHICYPLTHNVWWNFPVKNNLWWTWPVLHD